MDSVGERGVQHSVVATLYKVQEVQNFKNEKDERTNIVICFILYFFGRQSQRKNGYGASQNLKLRTDNVFGALFFD